MKIFFRLFLLFFGLSVFQAHGIADSDIDPNKRVVLIFLDDTEAWPYEKSDDDSLEEDSSVYRGGAISEQFLAAVIASSSPIIVSGSLLFNILILLDRDKETDKDFIQAVQDEVDYTKWEIRKVKRSSSDQLTDLFCMIPKSYLEEQKKLSTSFEKSNAGTTALEYQLGLQFDHMEPIPMESNDALFNYFIKRDGQYTSKQIEALHENTGFDFVKSLNEIFVLSDTYQKNKRAIPKVSIFLLGHGQYGESIANLKFNEFNSFLDFLQKKIKTTFLIYISCYAAGFNAQQVYGDLTKKGVLNTYSFAIATQALTDSSVVMGIDINSGKIVSSVSFDSIIESLLKMNISYKEVLGYFMPILEYYHFSSIPQIRFPYSPAWFPITESDKAAVSITNTMVDTRNRSLIVKEYEFEGEKKDPAVILLYSDEVPFVVQIDTVTMPTLISMVSGEAFHFLKEVKAIQTSFEDFFRSMSKIKYGIEKEIFIKSLITKNAVLKDVLINYAYEMPMTFNFTMFDDVNSDGTKKHGSLKNEADTLEIVDQEYELPEEYCDIQWTPPIEIPIHKELPDIVKRSIATHAAQQKKFRLQKANHLIISLLYPHLSYVGRCGLGNLFERAQKKEEEAINDLRIIFEALMSNNIKNVQSLVAQVGQKVVSIESYKCKRKSSRLHKKGKSKRCNKKRKSICLLQQKALDFTIKDFQQKRWQDMLFSLLNDSQFDFLDDYRMPATDKNVKKV